jgi:hypothetical protein
MISSGGAQRRPPPKLADKIAGVGETAPLLQVEVDKLSDLIALNVDALTHLTYPVAPGFVERGGGTIINVASIARMASEVLNGVCGGAEAFLALALSQSLKHEPAEKGVPVHVLLPCATTTDPWSPLAHRSNTCPARSWCRPGSRSVQPWRDLT